MNQFIAVGLFLIWIMGSYTAVQFKLDFKKVAEKYDSNNLFLKLDVIEIEGRDTSYSKVEIKRNGNKYYYTNGLSEMLYANGKSVTVDHDAKLVAWSSSASEGFESIVANIDSVSIDSFNINTLNQGWRDFYFSDENRICYNVIVDANGLIKKYTISQYADSKMKKKVIEMQINYREQKWDIPYKESDFSIEKYISLSGDSVLGLSVKYKNYELIVE